ncbi:hypothetical protein C8R47DRAFT_1143301 [Mycena vitilis]|nr:hypothetical protein C8R47DRAFT_1143301 [Mycena vitilis]
MPSDIHLDAWQYAIRFLLRTPEGPDSRRVLSTMTAQQLFSAALSSRRLYYIVTNYVEHLGLCGLDLEVDDWDGSDGGSEHSVADSVRLPTRLGRQILGDLALADHLKYAQVSQDGASAAGEALQNAAVSILRRFGLRFTDVRLMQTATGAIISGSTIPSMMATIKKFHPRDLDVYAGRGKGFDVMRFLTKGGKYRLVGQSGTYDFAAGIGKVYTVRHIRTGREINVIESLTDNPLDAVAHFHSTCVFGAWTAEGFWHAYPRLTFAGLSMTSASNMPLLNDLVHHKRVWRILRKYCGRGFSFVAEHSPPHACGVDSDCPCTMRSSDDEGCMLTRFPGWHFTSDVVPVRATTWSLNGTGCSSGILAHSDDSKGPAVSYWKQMLKEYAVLRTAPNYVLSMEDLWK